MGRGVKVIFSYIGRLQSALAIVDLFVYKQTTTVTTTIKPSKAIPLEM